MPIINYRGFELNESQVRAIEKFVELIAPLQSTTPTGSIITTFPENGQIPLDKIEGRDLGVYNVTADKTITPAPGAVHAGFATVEIVGDGTHVFDISAFNNPWNSDINNAAGQHQILFFEYRNNNAYVYVVSGPILDLLAPTLISAVVEDADPSHVILTWSEAMAVTPAAVSAFTLSGVTLTAHEYVDSHHTRLATSAPIAPGNPIHYLSYSQPAGTKQRDLSNNLVANFSNVAMTNNVIEHVPPTILSADVFNSAPTEVVITWSEDMSATISAAAAFTVSGHTVSAHARVDARHTKLTVTAPFEYMEAARTLAYTQPGSNKMQDLAGNLAATVSGVAITNNVAGVAFFDNFNRADGSTGNGWIELQGPSLVASNKAVSAPGDAAFNVQETGLSVCTVSADIQPIANQPQIRFLCIDASNFWAVLAFADLGFFRLYKMVGGAPDNIDSGGSFTPNTSTPQSISVTIDSSHNITVKQNGVTIITANDAEHAGATKHGYFIDSNGSTIDNFQVA